LLGGLRCCFVPREALDTKSKAEILSLMKAHLLVPKDRVYLYWLHLGFAPRDTVRISQIQHNKVLGREACASPRDPATRQVSRRFFSHRRRRTLLFSSPKANSSLLFRRRRSLLFRLAPNLSCHRR